MADKSFADNELVTFENSQGLKARGTLLKLSQNYIVFEVYNPYSIVQLSEVLSKLTISRSEKQIYCGKAVVTNIVNTGIVLIVSAVLSEASWINTLDIRSKKGIQDEINHLVTSFESQQEIDLNFKLSIISIRSFLSDAKNWIDRFEPALENSDIIQNRDFVFEYLSPLLVKMESLFKRLGDVSNKIAEGKILIYKEFTQAHLHNFIMSSPFPYRIYSKPLGYAGDYEMMRMIQRENAEGPNLYAKFINTFYTNIPIANCVKNRTLQLVTLIEDGVKAAEGKGEEFNSLSVGCGPALEIKKFIETSQVTTKCNFKLLDFNEETLNFAVDQANKAKTSDLCEVTGEVNSVHELLKRSVNKKCEEEKYDFVYCSGLFDYLSDRVCARLIKLFFSMIKPGGKVFVTNMHSYGNDKHILELIFEWHLIYRDEQDMNSLVPGLGKQKLYTDSTGVNLCLEIEK